MQKRAVIFASVLLTGIVSAQAYPSATAPDLSSPQAAVETSASATYADDGLLWKGLAAILGQGVLKATAPSGFGT